MRATLTLDDDVAASLEAESRRSGRSFNDVVNTFIRMGLNAKRTAAPAKPFQVKARRLEALPGISFENIEACWTGSRGRDADDPRRRHRLMYAYNSRAEQHQEANEC